MSFLRYDILLVLKLCKPGGIFSINSLLVCWISISFVSYFFAQDLPPSNTNGNRMEIKTNYITAIT